MTTPLVEALGWSLIHSLWQCSLIALLLGVFNLCVRGARARYAAACMAMFLMAGVPLATFFSTIEYKSSVIAAETANVLIRGAAIATIPARREVSGSGAAPFLTITVWLWLTGVIAMSTWSAAAWVAAQRLKRRKSRVASETWRRKLAILATRMCVNQSVRLRESLVAQVPTVIGWLRPVILVPSAAFLQLSTAELEAVLAHELAHIRRHDYLVNLIQTLVETLLFYHPAVWWTGKRIRVEREHCCDDLAVALCGDSRIYARALVSLEEMRSAGPQFAMAATGGELSARIRRLLSSRERPRRVLPLWMLVGVSLTIPTSLLLKTQAAPSPGQQVQGPRAPAVVVHREGYLGGLAQAGYTNISVDEIIELKQNGVSPEYIGEMLKAGYGILSPRELINLKNQGITPDYARAVKSSGIRDISVQDVVRLRQNGVRPELLEALAASGYTNVTVSQLMQAQACGISASALRSVKEQGFKDLSLEQVIKLKRAGVI